MTFENNIYKILAVGSVVFQPFGVLCSAKNTKNNKPNIVIMIADDCTYRDLPCYGGVNAFTPNIDAIAEKGMLFTNCFQATPMSSPTRQCLMTGLYPVNNGAFPNHARVNDGTISIVQYMRDCGYRVGLQGKRHIAPQEVFDFEYLGKSGDDVNTELIRPFIEDCVEANTPFCLFVCSHQPHTPWNKGDQKAIDENKLVLPPYYVDTPETRRDFRNYIAEINYLDEQVGAVTNLISTIGIDDNTIMIFTSEQGNSLPYAKYTCYDMGVQTGMIIKWPGVIPSGQVSNALIEYVDVVPTCIEIGGGIIPENIDGKSFLPILLGKTTEHKNEVYSTQTSRGIINGTEGYGIRAVRNKQYVYIRNLHYNTPFRCETIRLDKPTWSSWIRQATTDSLARKIVFNYIMRPEEELYDRINDCYFLNNLADNPEFLEIKMSLSAQLDSWMERCNDKGVETEADAFNHQVQNQKSSQAKFLEAYRGKILIDDPNLIETDGIYYLWGKDCKVYRSIDIKHWEGPCQLSIKEINKNNGTRESIKFIDTFGKTRIVFKNHEERLFLIEEQPTDSSLRFVPCEIITSRDGKEEIKLFPGSSIIPIIY